MKHFFFFSLLLCLITKLSIAQSDTLFFENFEVNDPDSIFLIGIPSGFDPSGLNYDADQIPDGSGAGRPDEWFLIYGFADADSADICFGSNSWTNNPDPVANYLILPPLQIVDTTAKLTWESAPRQTPRFLDGYYVVVSTSCNVEDCFLDTLFKAAEYISAGNLDTDSGFSHYTFSPGFVHGEDGDYIEYHNDSARFIGTLHPFTESLSQYAGQTIYIAFVHGTHDDNLIEVDDILVTGTAFTGIQTPVVNNELQVFPNPASNVINLQFKLQQTSRITIDILNAEGKVVMSKEAGTWLKGNEKISLNVSRLSAGNYQVRIHTNHGDLVRKIEVQ